MPDILTLHADENSTYVVNVAFLDEDGTAVAPSSAEWTLQDSDGTVMNSRKDVAITTPGETEEIALQGDDLKFETGETGNKVRRELTVEYVYDSNLGADNPGTSSVYFWLDRIGRYKTT